MNKTCNSWFLQKSIFCSIFLFHSFTSFSQNTIETSEKEQVQIKIETSTSVNQTKVSTTATVPVTSTSALGSSTINESNSKKSEIVILKENVEFPKYIETGDPIKDSESYALRKQKWIEQYPEEYQLLINPKK